MNTDVECRKCTNQTNKTHNYEVWIFGKNRFQCAKMHVCTVLSMTGMHFLKETEKKDPVSAKSISSSIGVWDMRFLEGYEGFYGIKL